MGLLNVAIHRALRCWTTGPGTRENRDVTTPGSGSWPGPPRRPDSQPTPWARPGRRGPRPSGGMLLSGPEGTTQLVERERRLGFPPGGRVVLMERLGRADNERAHKTLRDADPRSLEEWKPAMNLDRPEGCEGTVAPSALCSTPFPSDSLFVSSLVSPPPIARGAARGGQARRRRGRAWAPTDTVKRSRYSKPSWPTTPRTTTRGSSCARPSRGSGAMTNRSPSSAVFGKRPGRRGAPRGSRGAVLAWSTHEEAIREYAPPRPPTRPSRTSRSRAHPSWYGDLAGSSMMYERLVRKIPSWGRMAWARPRFARWRGAPTASDRFLGRGEARGAGHRGRRG